MVVVCGWRARRSVQAYDAKENDNPVRAEDEAVGDAQCEAEDYAEHARPM